MLHRTPRVNRNGPGSVQHRDLFPGFPFNRPKGAPGERVPDYQACWRACFGPSNTAAVITANYEVGVSRPLPLLTRGAIARSPRTLQAPCIKRFKSSRRFRHRKTLAPRRYSLDAFRVNSRPVPQTDRFGGELPERLLSTQSERS
jgi:hypothetical protein